jgi:hypothetical protein
LPVTGNDAAAIAGHAESRAAASPYNPTPTVIGASHREPKLSRRTHNAQQAMATADAFVRWRKLTSGCLISA